jgi:hypothetical protein
VWIYAMSVYILISEGQSFYTIIIYYIICKLNNDFFQGQINFMYVYTVGVPIIGHLRSIVEINKV